LERVLSEGVTYDQFADSFKKFFIEYGIVPEKAIRLDTIFRTNLFTAYTAGLVSQVDQVKDRFPIWRYVAVRDARTRPSHAQLNNQFFKRGPYPPISYNCRCTPQFIHELQQAALGNPRIYDSIYDIIDRDEVVDFISGKTFEQWTADNPVSPGIQSVINEG
jgi:SPP1 gp7 family putative phage head morphogenesis protein